MLQYGDPHHVLCMMAPDAVAGNPRNPYAIESRPSCVVQATQEALLRPGSSNGVKVSICPSCCVKFHQSHKKCALLMLHYYQATLHLKHLHAAVYIPSCAYRVCGAVNHL